MVFLDEPTTGPDAASRASIRDEVRRLNRDQGVAGFLTTQYLNEADELADRVASCSFALLCGFWGLALTGFSCAIALKAAKSAAVDSAFLVFFLFAFITTTTLPRAAMMRWLRTLVSLNPVTYVVEGLRSVISGDWSWSIFGAIVAVLYV